MADVTEISSTQEVFQRKIWQSIEYALENDLSLLEIVGALDTIKTSIMIGDMIEIEVECDG